MPKDYSHRSYGNGFLTGLLSLSRPSSNSNPSIFRLTKLRRAKSVGYDVIHRRHYSRHVTYQQQRRLYIVNPDARNIYQQTLSLQPLLLSATPLSNAHALLAKPTRFCGLIEDICNCGGGACNKGVVEKSSFVDSAGRWRVGQQSGGDDVCRGCRRMRGRMDGCGIIYETDGNDGFRGRMRMASMGSPLE